MSEEMPSRYPSPKYLEAKKAKAKGKITDAFSDYKSLLSDKTHPDNQTDAYHNNVISILNRLLTSADDLDDINPGEGIFGLIILSLRSSLRLKDEIVKLEVENRSMRIEIEKLKKRSN
jgi:hypothetical protein